MTRLEQQIQFIVEIDKVKSIFRQTLLADGSRRENDAEHSWHIAIMALLLKEYAEEEVDVPLRYNNDKRKKPLFSRGLSVCRHLFNSFSKLKCDEKIIEKRRLFH